MAVALVVALVILGLVLWIQWLIGGPGRIGAATDTALAAFDGLTTNEQKVEAYGKLMAAIGLLMAAPIGLLGIILAFWRTFNQHRDSLVSARKLDAETYAKAAEAFAKAVEHLGNDKISIRMGAALSLDALGKSTPRLLSQAIEVLCAYVRETRRSTDLEQEEEGGSISLKEKDVADIPTDIILMLEIIIRLHCLEEGIRIPVNLRNTDMKKLIIYGANFKNVNMYKSDLRWASLYRVDLTGAMMNYANLQNARLNEAVMRSVMIANADLRGAYLQKADLSDALMSGANLSGVDLSGANLRRTYMGGVDLSMANLSEADLRGSRMGTVNLSGAKLNKANLSGTYLSRANLSGADLSGANLSGADLAKANLNKTNLTDAILTDAILPQ
ncbi:pentapeptide repeat-containing protein [Azospirillum doebereinerae]|uniref:Pentapeptide repeat-containing protein n=1 Tax=Azospirillum doebereinerae TaxID=92933 RepID=A0A433J1C0_9PROT|nr:pentapeptide repeat-containing protein [Azospirillum doebereinerae]RUQ64005.1 pentapeptide repeat-containing protein [Azospirillum doebereinerae]